MSTEQREHVHGMWANVADRWAEHAEYLEGRAAELNKALLDGVALAPGDRVLELACGPGGLTLAAARIAREVVASDVVPAMVAAAAERAARAGLTNVTTKVLDLEEIEEPDDSFDVVLVREGLMFAVDPAAAACEIRRVLRPGGRAGVSVWGPKVDNPWLSIVMDAVSAHLGHEVPPPGMPGPFSLADASRFVGLFGAAGFVDIELGSASAPVHADSFDEWWSRTQALAGPLSGILAMLPAPALGEIEQRARAAAAPFESADGIDLPGVALVVTARS
jgi:ubiquinone/menaquinone biosynthesis C-methylase UbiE